MKKNYSQKFVKAHCISSTNVKDLLTEKSKTIDSPMNKVFARKPVATYIPLSRKKDGEQNLEIDSTMGQTNFSQILQKSKTLKFVSTRSQVSLNSSKINRSNASLYISNSKMEQIEQYPMSSTLLPCESISPSKTGNQKQLFRRKTVLNTRTPVLNKKRANQSSQNLITLSSSVLNRGQKYDNAQQSTKLQSSELSENRQSYRTPTSSYLMNRNLVQNSKNSSKDSLRKSNSSNSLIKKQPVNACQQCQFHQRETKDYNSKLQRLERIIQNKDDEINILNRKINDFQKKNRQLQKKVKDIQKIDYPNRIAMLEEQLVGAQDECTRNKQTYEKSLQELKYRNVQNSALKKYQAQCQGLQRKCQMLVSQRNQLRQRILNVQTSSKSSYINYPSPSYRMSKSINFVKKSPKNDTSINGRTLTSRDEDESSQLDEEETYSTIGGFKKKYKNCYQDSEQSSIISLSEESNF